jgi:hypothetical protein
MAQVQLEQVQAQQSALVLVLVMSRVVWHLGPWIKKAM